jgi:ribonuclease HII
MNELQKHDFAALESLDYITGIDEAGRGCLAGPVMAGACVVSREFFESLELMARTAEINDSKQMDAGAREAIFGVMEGLKAEGWLDFAVAEGSVGMIAERNILGATRAAMGAALEMLAARAKEWTLPLAASDGPLFESGEGVGVRILVDGRPLKPFPFTHTALVKGDGRSLVIAMASIAAKVSRDRRMEDLEEKYPGYGFAQHKGYGTAAHRAALLKLGPCEAHRELFLRKVLGGGAD